MRGTTISHYKILSKLGEGSMGVVYKAQDMKLGRTVALKFLAPHLLTNEDAKKRFVREAKAVAALDHPNICTLYEIDEAKGRTFMAMAYLDGQVLEDKIATGPFNHDLALDIAKQIAKGLQEAHSKGISHRDIKPSNVSLVETSSKDLLAKIMDFGLAHLAGQTQLTQHGTILGTVAYMSPEQTQAAGVDHRTDIWALGVVLYEMVSGQRPFRGEYDRAVMYSMVSEEPEPLTSLRTGVPMELEWIVGKALAKDRERRYQSGIEFIVDLENLATKLRAESLRVASPVRPVPSRGIAAPSGLEGQRASWPRDPELAGPASVEKVQVLRKRQIRELILDLGGKGLLPDRILSQAIEVISRGSDESSETGRIRNHLLDDLLYGRVRVGEFIEQWHHSESEQQASVMDEPDKKEASKKKRKSCDVRSQAEIFGIPLSHKAWGKDPSTGKERIAMGVFACGNISVGLVACARWIAKSCDVRSQAEIFGIPLSHKAWGKDPSTGKERIAMGVFACGNISVGLVACARWIAIGGIAISPVSIGIWALGLLSIGLHANGVFNLSVSRLPFWQALLIAIAAALVGGFLFNRHKVRGLADGDLLNELALFSLREWRDSRTSFRGGRVIAIAARYVVDLTEIQPPGQEVVIEANALLGAVRIRVPEGWHLNYAQIRRSQRRWSCGGRGSRVQSVI